MALDEKTGTLYVAELTGGRVVAIRVGSGKAKGRKG